MSDRATHREIAPSAAPPASDQVPNAGGPRVTGSVRALAGGVIPELHRRAPFLAALGWMHLATFAAGAALALVDPRTVLGVGVWIKPMKFAISIALYLMTVGWLLHYLKPTDPGRVRWISAIVGLSMVGEMVLIFSQSARGVQSHFNAATPYDAAVFQTMGVLIVLNTLAALWATILFYRRDPVLPRAYLWGIRLGLTVFLVSAVSGGMMVGLQAHAVGVVDGGPGLPFLNWSREGGDLRVAHFVAMHAIQMLPLIGFVAHRASLVGRLRRPVAVTVAAAVLMLAAHTAVLLHALAGRPLM